MHSMPSSSPLHIQRQPSPSPMRYYLISWVFTVAGLLPTYQPCIDDGGAVEGPGLAAKLHCLSCVGFNHETSSDDVELFRPFIGKDYSSVSTCLTLPCPSEIRPGSLRVGSVKFHSVSGFDFVSILFYRSITCILLL